MVKKLPMRETQVQFLGGQDPLEKGTALHPVFLPEKSHRQRSLVGHSSQVTKNGMLLSD